MEVTYNMTSSENGTEAPSDGRNEQIASIEISVQAFIFCMALIGNSLVLVALRYRKKKTSRMHLFIFHLSIADLLVAFCNILPQLIWDITYRFQGNDFLCRLVKYLQVMVMYLSTYVLVMTAVDRYRAICHPLSNYSCATYRVHVMIGAAWLLSLLLAAPQIPIFSLSETAPGSGTYDCWATFEPKWTLKLYITCFSVSVYIIPFLLLTLLYGRICYEVWKNLRKKKGGLCEAHQNGKVVYKFHGNGTISIISPEGHVSHEISDREPMTPRRHSLRGFSAAKMKTIKLTFVVIIAYLLCWSPFFIAQLWWAFDESAPINNSVFVICLLLGSLNSCVNPWIYMAFSGSLIQQVLPCCRKSPKPRLNLIPMRNVAKERVHKSDSFGEENKPCKCHDRMLLDYRKHGPNDYCHHGAAAQMLQQQNLKTSHTSSTKLTGHTFSPTVSWKRAAHHTICTHKCCQQRETRLGSDRLLQCSSCTQASNKRDEIFSYRSPYRRERCQICNKILHRIQEERQEAYEAAGRGHCKTRSYPSLHRSLSSYERVDPRCTTSV